MSRIIRKIRDKLAYQKDVLAELAKLSNSELNSLLLELFREKAGKTKPSVLLRQFNENRFVSMADTDIIKIKETEITWLKYARDHNYKPLNLSPLAPLGSCSSIGLVDQNNVVSGLRGTEVVSDATNILALKIADDFKKTSDKHLISRYAATHRHVRAQYFTNPNFTAHFSVFCLASGGYDKGNHEFEIMQLKEHIGILFHLLNKHYKKDTLVIRFYSKYDSGLFLSRLQHNKDPFWKDKQVEFAEEHGSNYYKTIQFKIFLKKNDQLIDLADGGLVDWTQKLIENKKHRLMISGIGLELVEKL